MGEENPHSRGVIVALSLTYVWQNNVDRVHLFALEVCGSNHAKHKQGNTRISVT